MKSGDGALLRPRFSLLKTFLTLTLVFGLGSVFWYLRVKTASVYVYATPEGIYYGVARLPFQYRILTALIVRFIHFFFSKSGLLVIFGWIDVSVTIGVFILFEAMLKTYRLPWWGCLLFFWCALSNYVYFSPNNFMEPYDMPAILIFCAGLQAIYYRRKGWFYGMLVLGMLNRETAGLLTCGFILVEYNRLSRTRLLQHIAAQAVIIITIKVILFFIYRHNLGVPFELMVQHSSPTSLDPTPSHILNNTDYLLSGKLLPLFGGMWFLFGCTFWFIEDRILRRLLWIVPIEFVCLLVLGRMIEFRIFNESVPLVVLGTTAGLSGLITRWFSRGHLQHLSVGPTT